MTDFVHLHVHTEQSGLDGHSRIPRLVSSAAQLGQRALAITDHGTMAGVLDFYDACRAQNINPILGVEAYIAPNMREKGESRFEYNHLLLLAKNKRGYQNLLRLVTLSHTRGFYQKPRIDKETLAQYSDGLIATSGCLAGEIPQFFLSGQDDKARLSAEWYLSVFGRDNYFMEVQNHLAGGDQDVVNPKVIELARRLNVSLLPTNDLHYVHKADAPIQDVMLCIQTGARVADTDRMRFDGPEYYLKSGDEMERAFSGLEDTLANTVRVAEMCNVEIDFGRHLLPDYEVPNGESQEKYLRRLIHAGLVERYGVDWREKTIAGVNLLERENYEFNIILAKGFVPYFLIVWDYVNYARSHGMRCVARGSVAGSIVAYALGISNVDPLYYGLLFERFLNPERNSMPDIDMDFPDDRREEVIRYVAEKYGWDKVGQIATSMVMQAKTAVRDVGRVFGDYQTADRISRVMPNGATLNGDNSELKHNETLIEMYQGDPQARAILDFARHLDGTVRGDSVHAAGVVVSNVALDEVTPCQHLKRQRGLSYEGKTDAENMEQRWLVTQYGQSDLERLGLIKFDFLGLSNLTILQSATALIKQYYGVDIDLDRIPADDPKVFDMLSRGETTGIFQLESSGMRSYIRELKPTSVSDIMAMVALYRPGPMDSIPRFIKAKHGLIPPEYPHPDVEDILRDSYGVIVYQDQVLLVAKKLAGLSWAELDKFRKAIGKKIMTGPDSVEAQKKKFVAGCVKNGIDEQKALEVFAYIEPFAGYGFNAAHACAYAWVAYQTAYIKVHYPAAFMAASLSKEAGDDMKVAHLIAECRRMGVDILPPNINKSGAGFTLEKREGRYAVRFGLSAIKGLGAKQCAGILAERAANGPFRTLPEVFARVPGRSFTRGTAEVTIKAGAMVNLGGDQASLLASLDRAKKLGEKYRGTPFMETLTDNHPLLSFVQDECEPATNEQQLVWMRESTGVYIERHPLDEYGFELLERADTRTCDITGELEYKTVTVAGIVSEWAKKKTQRGDLMASLTLEDLDGVVDVVIFPKTYDKCKAMLAKGNPLVITGKVQTRTFGKESLQIVAEEVTLYSRRTAQTQAQTPVQAAEAPLHHIVFTSQGGKYDIQTSRKIVELLATSPGTEGYVVWRALTNGQKMRMRASTPEEGVTMTPTLRQALLQVTGVDVQAPREEASVS